jgi:hypothetical protein
MGQDSTAVRIGIGLGGLAFGASMAEVRSYLGDPDECTDDLLSPNPSVHWSYPSLGIDAYFSGEDGYVLGTLSTENPDARLLGETLVGRPEAHVRSWLEHNLGEAKEELLEFSDHPTMSRLSYPEKSIEFWFQFEKLDSIMWSYLIGNDDQPRWPG